MIRIVKPPPLVRQLFSKAIWKIATKEKVVFLTFDDGPTPIVTEQVLDLLKQYHAKATFFCVGENIQRYPNIFQRIIAEGHAVGNHTYNHLRGTLTPNEVYYENITKCQTLTNSRLFRPPYGRMNYQQYRYLLKTYDIVLWDILSWDFDPSINPQQCANKVISNVRNGSIIVFHDSEKAKQNCLGALQKTLQYLQEMDYSCISIPFR